MSRIALTEMGESVDDLADSTSKLRGQIKSLTGVDIMLDENTYKSTADIIQEIGAVWDKLTDVSKASTLEILAGKTRASTVAGLIENYKTIEEVIKATEEAENSARIENEKYLDSIEGRTNLLKTQLQELAYVAINDQGIKDIISLFTKLLEVITNITKEIGALPAAATLLGGYLSTQGVGRPKMYGLSS